jgi:hypothetical protein
MERTITKTIEVEGRRFVVTKYTAIDGFNIAKLLLAKIMPAFQSFLPLLKQGFANADNLSDAIMENLSLDEIGGILAKMSESESKYVITKSLQRVEEQLKAGGAPVMDANGAYGVLDIEYDILLVLRLTCEAVLFGCSDFLDGNRLISVMKPLSSSLRLNHET